MTKKPEGYLKNEKLEKKRKRGINGGKNDEWKNDDNDWGAYDGSDWYIKIAFREKLSV